MSADDNKPNPNPNPKHKLRRPKQPRTRLCDRRLARRLALETSSTTTTTTTTAPKCILRIKKPLTTRNPELALKIAQMKLPIHPIVHVLSGHPAPDFPTTMLGLFTLTEPQLDALAVFYSQSSSSSPSFSSCPSCPTSSYNNHNNTNNTNSLKHAYPQTMDWTRPCLTADTTLPADCQFSDMERLKVKMRMFARFIGMRGAETPGWEYERQVEVLGRRIRRVVRGEGGKEWRGLW